MPEPKVRFMKDDGSRYPAWKEYSISDLFTKIGNKNKDGQNTNVITNSAEFGLIPQRDYFDKDIAVEGNTGNYTIIQTGDFVYNPRKSSYAPMGPFNCYRLEEDGIVSPLYSCLRPKGVLNPEYLLWYFQTDKWYGYVNEHGAQNGARHDRVGMTDKILMGIPVTAPCEEEQQKISDFLSSVDEVISTSEQEVANLETQKKAVMKKIFSQEVRFKRTDGSDFPEWEERRLDEVVEFLDGMRKPIETGDRVAGPYPYYGASGITDYVEGYIFDEDLILLSEDGANILDRNYRVCFMARGKYWVNNHAHVLRANTDCVNEYICEYLESLDYSRMNSGSAQPKLNQQTCRKIPVKKPCLEEQRLIADFLSDFDEAIAAAKKELELWKELKKGLLQQMFV